MLSPHLWETLSSLMLFHFPAPLCKDDTQRPCFICSYLVCICVPCTHSCLTEQHLTHPIQSQGAVWSMNQAAIADRVSRRSHVYQTLFFFSFRVWLHGLNTYPLQTSILLGNELFTNWHGLRLHLVSSDNMTLILVVASQCHTLCNMIVLFLSSYLPQSPLGIVVLHWGRRGLGSPGSLTHSRRSVREL